MSHSHPNEAAPADRLGRVAGIGFGTVVTVVLTAIVVVALTGVVSRELRLTGSTEPVPVEAPRSTPGDGTPVIHSFSRPAAPPAPAGEVDAPAAVDSCAPCVAEPPPAEPPGHLRRAAAPRGADARPGGNAAPAAAPSAVATPRPEAAPADPPPASPAPEPAPAAEPTAPPEPGGDRRRDGDTPAPDRGSKPDR